MPFPSPAPEGAGFGSRPEGHLPVPLVKALRSPCSEEREDPVDPRDPKISEACEPLVRRRLAFSQPKPRGSSSRSSWIRVPRLASRQRLQRVGPKTSAAHWSEDLCSKAWCLARPSSNPKARLAGVVSVSARSFRTDPKVSLKSPRQVGRSPSLLCPEGHRSVLFCPEGHQSCGLRSAAPRGVLRGPEGPVAAPFSEPWPNPVAGPVRRPCLLPNGTVSLSPVAPSVRRPRSLPTRAAGLVTRRARSEDLALRDPMPPVSSLGWSGPKTCPSRGQEPSTSSAGSLGPKTRRTLRLGR